MNHPMNRLERHLIGVHKGVRRSEGMSSTGHFSAEWVIRNSRTLRNTTKTCSCSMCGNPRRKSWKDKLTMQEKRYYCGMDWSGSSPVS